MSSSDRIGSSFFLLAAILRYGSPSQSDTEASTDVGYDRKNVSKDDADSGSEKISLAAIRVRFMTTSTLRSIFDHDIQNRLTSRPGGSHRLHTDSESGRQKLSPLQCHFIPDNQSGPQRRRGKYMLGE
jgi:hypothetical protein